MNKSPEPTDRAILDKFKQNIVMIIRQFYIDAGYDASEACAYFNCRFETLKNIMDCLYSELSFEELSPIFESIADNFMRERLTPKDFKEYLTEKAEK